MKKLVGLFLLVACAASAQQQFAIVTTNRVVKLLPPGLNPTSYKFSKVIVTNVVPSFNPATEYIPQFQVPTELIELTNGVPSRLRLTFVKATKSPAQLEFDADQAAIDYAKATAAIAELAAWRVTLNATNNPTNANFQNAMRDVVRTLEQVIRYLRRDIPAPEQ